MSRHVDDPRTPYERAITWVYAAVFAAGIVVLALDLHYWRPDTQQIHPAHTQPAKQQGSKEQ